MIMSSSEKIIQEYLDLENKTISTIEPLANKYGITTKEFIAFLKQYNIETPRILSRIDAIDWNDNTIKEISNEIDLESDISVAVSVQKQFSDFGFNKKKGSKRIKGLCQLAETIGIDVFGDFVSNLVKKIKNHLALSLENDLEDIKSGNFSISEKNTESELASIYSSIYLEMGKMTKEILTEPEEVKEKVERVQKPQRKKPFLNEKLIEDILKLTNPTYYNFLMKTKEIGKRQQTLHIIREALEKQEAMQTIKSVFEKLEPKISIVDKPKPKPRKKREFTEDEVVKLLEGV